MRFFNKTVIAAVVFLSCSSLAQGANDKPLIPTVIKVYDTDETLQANALEAQAIDLIDNNKVRLGLEFMHDAVDLDPTPMRHMNYASMLFSQGASEYKTTQSEESLKTLRLAENQLSLAIAKLDPHRHEAFVSQAYFLLGEIYLFAYQDTDKARTFYYKSLEYTDNTNARRQIEAIR